MIKGLNQKILGMLLVLTMIFTMLPVNIFATNTISIDFTVTDISELVDNNNQWGGFQLDKDNKNGLVRIPLQVPSGTSSLEAIKIAHEKFHEGANGYKEADGFFSKLWGKTTSNIAYFVNGKMVMDTTSPLNNGDDLEVTIYKDWNSDIYSRFGQQEIKVLADQNFEVTLLHNVITTSDFKSGMMAGEIADKPLEGATILVGDETSQYIPYDDSKGIVTNSQGKANISFENPGTYYLSCKKLGTSLIPAVSKVTVEAAEDDMAKKETITNDKNLITLQDNIAENYVNKDVSWWKESGTFWHTVGIGSYNSMQTLSKKIIDQDSKQKLANKLIGKIIKKDVSASKNANNLANAINGLSALGYDASHIYTMNGVKIDAFKELNSISLTDAKKGWYSTIAPYVIQAMKQCDFKNEMQEEAYVEYLLNELKNANWSWGVDTPMMIVQGLTPYYSQENVKKEIDTTLIQLSSKQGDNGSFGNTNGDAMAIIALVQLGINPSLDSRFIKNGNSILDGMLLYQTPEKNGFGFKNKTYNEMSTYQGFIALNSVININKSGIAYNPYNFSTLPKSIIKATSGNTDVVPPAIPETDNLIKVSFKLQNINQTWISDEKVQVKKGSKVYHVFIKALADKGFTSEGAEKNYVKSITNPSGIKVGEFSDRNGTANVKPNSGWLYKVNGELPLLGICEKEIEDGDIVEFYFTEDYTKDPDAGSIGGVSGKPEDKPQDKPAKEEENKVTSTIETEAKTDASTGKAEATISESTVKDTLKNALDAVKKAEAEGKKDVKPVVEVNIKADKNSKHIETKMPANAIKEVAKDAKAEIKLKTPVGDINMDNKALKEIAKSVGTEEVKLSIAKPDTSTMPEAKKKEVENLAAGRPILELSIKAGDKNISSFGDGSVTVSIPYVLEKGEVAGNLLVYFVDENGNAKPMETIYDAKTGKLNFTTGHFSTYVVGYKEETDAVKEEMQAFKKLKIKLSSKASKGRIKLVWKGGNQKIVDGYQVFRSTKKNSGYTSKPLYKTSNEKKTTYTNTKNLKKGTRYFYKVRAYKIVDGKRVYSKWSTKAYRKAR